jgi:hypothetical protein
MPITFQKSNQLKSIAILMMLVLHLFNRDYKGLLSPLLFLILFVVVLGWLLGKEGYPGTWQQFLLTFTGVQAYYNGAWWYFTIYILFIFTSRFWFGLLEKVNPYFYLGLLFLIYFIAFYFRIYKPTIFEYPVLQWLHTQGALYFCTLFQFMLGAFALKYHWHGKVSAWFDRIGYSNLIGITGIILLIIIHGLIPNFVIAPFTALGFIFLFLQINWGRSIDKALDFFTPHSTNLWLVHMFFYLVYFKEIIYAPQYPVFIFGWLVLWCLIASYLVNIIFNKVEKALL